MKKFIALAIAVVMLAALAVPAFAATITESGNVVVTYNVKEEYTVTIPDAMTFGTAANLSVVGNVEKAKTITVTSAGEWKLGGQGYKLVDGEGTDINVEGAILTSGTGAEVNTVVSINTAWQTTPPAAAGTYTDTLTFTVA